jgi:hypothetical protein
MKREKLKRMGEGIFNTVHSIFPQTTKKDGEVAKLVKLDEVLPITSEVLMCVRTFDIARLDVS